MMPTKSIKQTTNNTLATLVLEKYGFIPRRIYQPQKGYRNASHPTELTNGQIVNIIFYKTEADTAKKIKNANQVSDFLAGQGFPTRRTLGKIMQLKSDKTIKYCAPYTYLPGSTIPWEGYTKDHIKLLGKTMSDMHASLRGLNIAGLVDVTGKSSALNKRMRHYFQDTDVAGALQTKLGLSVNLSVLEALSSVLSACSHLPDQQILHMDFVRGNILFVNKPSGDLKFSVSGILDFEKTAYGHSVFDIARTLAFLLVDCKLKNEDKVRKYFIESGYNKRGAITFNNHTLKLGNWQIDLLEKLLNFYLLHDFYKFLRHNPYEFLDQNQHFTRTRDILLRRGILLEW